MASEPNPVQTPEPADPDRPFDAMPADTGPEPAYFPAHAEPVTTHVDSPAIGVALVEAGAPTPRSFFGRQADAAKKNPGRYITYSVLLLLTVVGFFWPAVPEPHVALGGEPIRLGAPWWLTNSVLTTLIIDVILLLVVLAVRVSIKLVPGGIQNFMEILVEYFYNLAEQIAGKAARQYFPWAMTIFLLVVISNWTGLIPGVGSIGWEYEETHTEEATEEHGYGSEAQLAMADGNLILLSRAQQEEGEAQEEGATGEGAEEHAVHFVPLFRAPSADLNFTLALALGTMTMVQVWGIRALGGSYFRKFFNASGKGFMKGISVFVGILELISEFARIISFGFRLFGNIFAGEIVLATMAFLAAFIVPLPFYALEVFIGLVQAFVFTMLALVFFSMATVSHGEHHEEHAEHEERVNVAQAPAAAH